MDDYIVKLTSQSEEQIQKIINYIVCELKAPEAALHLLNTFENSFASLGCFPQRVALIDCEPWRTNGIHCLPIKNFFVYFWINEETKTVQIIAVIYNKRDQMHQLSLVDME